MAQQQEIYNYFFHPGEDIVELFYNLAYILQHLINNLLIISYGNGVNEAIRLAERLERNRKASKIRVRVGLYLVDGQNEFPMILILMSTVMVPDLPRNKPNPDCFIRVHSFHNAAQEACAALEKGKYISLLAVEPNIPILITLFVTLRDFALATRINIFTSSNLTNQQAGMVIQMQGSISMPTDPLLNSGPKYGLLQQPHQALKMVPNPLSLPPQFPSQNLPPEVVQSVVMNPQIQEVQQTQILDPLPQFTGSIQNVAMNSQIQEFQQMQILGLLPQFTWPVQDVDMNSQIQAVQQTQNFCPPPEFTEPIQNVVINSQIQEDQHTQILGPPLQSIGPSQNVATNSQREEDPLLPIDILMIKRALGHLPDFTGPIQDEVQHTEGARPPSPETAESTTTTITPAEGRPGSSSGGGTTWQDTESPSIGDNFT